MEEQNQIEVIPAPVVEKKKRGRPVGWRGTYKKRVVETKTEEVKEVVN